MHNKLKRLMDAKGITPKYLAAKAGITTTTVYRIMAGANTGVYIALLIAQVLGCTLDDIFGRGL